MAEKAKPATATKANLTTAAKRLKTVEDALSALAKQFAKLDMDLTGHVSTPDAHNSAMLARKKDKKK